MILIYTPSVTNRVKYIFDFIFSQILQAPYDFTQDPEAFKNFEGPGINYSEAPLGTEQEIFFASRNLLFDTDIKQQDAAPFNWENMKCLFPVHHPESMFPFDPFAASFYLVTRYEEYLSHEKDRHQRYRAENSTAYRENFLDKPIINHWAISIRDRIQQKYSAYQFPSIPYSLTPSIDIDNAYAYKYKGVLRSVLSVLNQLQQGKFKRIQRRIRVHSGLDEDPYDSYEHQFHFHQQLGLYPNYFVLLGDYGKYDKNLSYKKQQFRELIKKLDENGEVGLHPSYRSNTNPEQLFLEKARMEEILNREVTKSRQHYLKLNLPETYQNLIKAGIKEDFTMGYASQAGFRASTSVPFYFYDLHKEAVTSLLVHPFITMDTSLKFYLRIRSQEVMGFINDYIEEVKNAGGEFSVIFHNESISGSRYWQNWEGLYEKIIKKAMP